MFVAALFTIAYTYTYTHTYEFNYEKEEHPAFVTIIMCVMGINLSEISQTKKDKYCLVLLICDI